MSSPHSNMIASLASFQVKLLVQHMVETVIEQDYSSFQMTKIFINLLLFVELHLVPIVETLIARP
jgi:hypothetical protein